MLDGTRTISEFVLPAAVEAYDSKPYSPSSSDTRNESPNLGASRTLPGEGGYERGMKKVWQAVLRECQRNDPERTGLVGRNSFVNALESSGESVSAFCYFVVCNILLLCVLMFIELGYFIGNCFATCQ